MEEKTYHTSPKCPYCNHEAHNWKHEPWYCDCSAVCENCHKFFDIEFGFCCTAPTSEEVPE
jgi:hypothetical protein